MALTKEQKEKIIQEVTQLLENSKMTVVANYKGVTVKSMQSLRKQAKDNGTIIKVVKNRLVIQAIKNIESLKNVEVDKLKDQLLYAFNDSDEISAAKSLNEFSKNEQAIEFIGGITSEGNFIDANEIKKLADLPSKHELVAAVVGLLNAPLRNTVSSISSNLHSYLNAIEKSKS